MRRSRPRSTPRLSMISHSMRDQPRHLGKLSLNKLKWIGATVVSREPIGALKKKPRISTRENRIKEVSCSPKSRNKLRDGAIRVSDQRAGAMRRSRPRLTPRQLMINHSMKDQPRHPGKLSPRRVRKLKDGAIRVSDQKAGAMRKLKPKSTKRLSMINLCTRDQPRLLGKCEDQYIHHQ